MTHPYLDPTSPNREQSVIAADLTRLAESQADATTAERAAAVESLDSGTWQS